MKTIIAATIAASLLTAPALAAPHQDHRGPAAQHQSHSSGQYRSWRKGERFNSREARNYRVISAPRNYRLKAPPRGYHWVQSGNDAVLIAITSGVIASVVAGAIR